MLIGQELQQPSKCAACRRHTKYHAMWLSGEIGMWDYPGDRMWMTHHFQKFQRELQMQIPARAMIWMVKSSPTVSRFSPISSRWLTIAICSSSHDPSLHIQIIPMAHVTSVCVDSKARYVPRHSGKLSARY